MNMRWEINISAFIYRYFHLDLIHNLEDSTFCLNPPIAHVTKSIGTCDWQSTEATPEDANHSLARRIGDEPQKFWDKVLWTDFMYQSDGKAKVWRKKDLLMTPNIQAHLKHSGGNVMAWAFIASSGTGSLIFSNDVTHDGSRIAKKNAKVWWCQWVTGLMQLLKAKDLQRNIKSFSL